MMPEANLSWPMLAGLILIGGFLIAIFKVVDTWSQRVSAGQAAKEIATAAMSRAEKAEADLAAFKEQVARDYVSQMLLEKMEDRVTGAVNRLGDRLDQLFTTPSGQPRRPSKPRA
jgi:hypothetical protein